MKLNWTIDNEFRHPAGLTETIKINGKKYNLRWRKCPINIRNIWVLGFVYETRKATDRIKDDWFFIIYYGKSYRVFSNKKI